MNSNKITQAIILSAGLGTRLRPLTDNIPKVMIPLLGKPLLLRHIEQLKKHGVKDIFINLHYLPDVIRDYFGDGSKFGVNIKYFFEEKEILGTAGGLKGFEKDIKDNFFVIYGDVFSLVNYSEMSNYFFNKDNAIGIEIIGNTDHPYDSDLVEVSNDSKFLKIYTKPHESIPEKFNSMKAIFVFNKKIFDFIPNNIYYEIDHQLLPEVIKNHNFFGYKCNDYLRDVGTIDRYNEVIDFLKNNKNLLD